MNLKTAEFLYGHSPVLAALKSNIRISRMMYIKDQNLMDSLPRSFKNQGTQDLKSVQVQEIINLASSRGVGVKYVSALKLDQMAQNRPHQGLVLSVSPYPVKYMKSIGMVTHRETGNEYEYHVLFTY